MLHRISRDSVRKIIIFTGLSFISNKHKSKQQPVSVLHNSKYLLHREKRSKDSLLLVIKLCHLNETDMLSERNYIYCHFLKVLDRVNHFCKRL